MGPRWAKGMVRRCGEERLAFLAREPAENLVFDLA
jgi:hypothetical protein